MRIAAASGWKRLRGGELTPWRAAGSVAVGLAIGVTPLYGLHIWIVVGVCLLLQLDAAVAYLAANVSIPPMIPFLLLAEVEIGSWVRKGHTLGLSAQEAKARALGELVREVVVGTAIFAPLVGVAGGIIAFSVASAAARKRPATALEGAIERVAARYARGRRATYGYVRGKLGSDPVAARIAEMVDLGEVLDVGCGRGQLAVLLLEAKKVTRVRGVDWDAKKVGDAAQAASGLAATFERGDAREALAAQGAEKSVDTVLFVDVLHYLTDEEQDVLVARAGEAARRRVIIRELDPDRGWRSAVTRMQERVTTSLGYNRGARVNVRPIDRLTAPLRARGFEVQVEPCWGAMPFANVLVVAERVPARESRESRKPCASTPPNGQRRRSLP